MSTSRLATLAWACSLSAGLLTGFAIYLSSKTLPSASDVNPGLGYWLGSILFAPLAETLLLWPLLRYLPLKAPKKKALLAGVIWGALHAFQRGPMGWAVTGPFFVFSLFFLAVDGRQGPRAAVWLTSLVHAAHNLTALGVIGAIGAVASS